MSIQTKIGNVTLNIPTDVSEITLGQFLDLRNWERDHNEPLGAFEVIEVLTGREQPELRSIKYTKKKAKQLQDVMALTNLLNASIQKFNTSPAKVAIPKSVSILGSEVKVSKELEALPFWPTRIVKDLIISKKKEDPQYSEVNDFDRIIAHFLYAAYTGSKYNETRAEEFAEIVKSELKFVEGIQLGNFFLGKLSKWLMPKPKYWLLTIQLKKYRLVYRISKFLGTSTH
ncbi:MAG: hypothetical protein QHC79_09430 [Pseudosphingobacterium sp.]|nr:hypothetical protein [Pseudosphingobacterium sp.]